MLLHLIESANMPDNKSKKREHKSDANHQASPDQTSRSLIERLKDNEFDAWQRLYLLYAPLVEYWCRKLAVPQQDIPDLVQDVFQTVARNVQSFTKENPSDTFRGWLRVITRSRVIDWRRRVLGKPRAAGGSTAQFFMARVPFDSAEINSAPTDDSQIEDQLTQQMYLRALGIIRVHFHENTWRAFWRVVVDGLAPSDVAKELSMKPGTVRVAKSRVLHRLRAELGDLIEVDETQV